MVSSLGHQLDFSCLEIKLGDFGVSTFHDPDGPTAEPAGTSLMWPPEQKWDAPDATLAGDVWALGGVIHDLAHGFAPVVDPLLTEQMARTPPNRCQIPPNLCKAQQKRYWRTVTKRKPLPINLEPAQHAFDVRRKRPTPKYSDELNECMQMALEMEMDKRATAGKLNEKVKEQEAAFLKIDEDRKALKQILGLDDEEDSYS